MSETIELPNSRLNKIIELLSEELSESEVLERDQPISWSNQHMFTCSQISKLLAISRGEDVEVAGIAGAIHDLAIIRTGKFENHGSDGGPMVKEFLLNFNEIYGKEFGRISEEELIVIVQSTINHTSKKIYSDCKFDELIKDADSLDRYLHGKSTYDFYTTRCENALKDFNLKLVE